MIAGLGNPGREYENTRHNLGFKAVEAVAERLNAGFRESGNYQISEGFVGMEKVILIKPLTFMNLSGDVVSKMLAYYKCEADHLIVIHDDLDIEPGRMKIKMGGGSGGHKGIESIISSIGNSEFLRIKIGIGRPEYDNTEGYVLSKIRGREKDVLREMVLKAADAVDSIVSSGYERAMNIFNTD